MRILVVTQHYWPEPLNSTEICEGLAERGHEVTVLAGEPNYPEGVIYPGYRANEVRRETRNGVSIVRSPLHPRGRGVVDRVWNYYSFPNQATKIARTLPNSFDVVLSYQTSPVLMVRPAIDFCDRTGTPLLLYCLDIWPECLTAGGIRRGSVVYDHYLRVSRRIYQSADLLAVTSPLFEGYLRDVVGVDLPNGVVDLPHFASKEFLAPAADPFPGFDRSKVNITFAGNVGAAQSPQTIVRAAALLGDDPRFAFHVFGDGSELDNARRLARDLNARGITFWGRLPLPDMPGVYAASDAMLVTFADNTLLGYTLPLKIHTYMAGGRPVLGAVNGDARRVIEEAGCGMCAPAEDANGLAEVCLSFASLSKGERETLGSNARTYYEDNFSMERFFERLEGALSSLEGRRHGI